MKVRGQRLVELATRKKSGDAADSTSSSHKQKHPSKELKLLPSSSSQETSLKKPPSLPKPGEVWEPYDFEHGSFLKMKDNESKRRLIDWFSRQYSADEGGPVTIGASPAGSTDHQNLEELHQSSSEIHILNSQDPHPVKIQKPSGLECTAEIPQAPRRSSDTNNDTNNSNDPTVPRSDPAAIDHPKLVKEEEVQQPSVRERTVELQQEPHGSPDTNNDANDPEMESGGKSKDPTMPHTDPAAGDHPNLEGSHQLSAEIHILNSSDSLPVEIQKSPGPECTAEIPQAPRQSPDTKNDINNSNDSTLPRSDPTATDHPNLEEEDEIQQPSVLECTAELQEAPHGSDTKNAANDPEMECGEKSNDLTMPHTDPATGDHPTLEESHKFPGWEKDLREFYNELSQEILATAEPHDDDEADDSPKPPEKQPNENIILEATLCNPHEPQTRKQHDSQALHGQQSDDDRDSESYKPLEFQNLDSSDDPEYEVHSSDLNESADELLPRRTKNKNRKKRQNEGEKAMLEFSQPGCSLDPNPEPHPEQNGAPKRKVQNPHERDKNTRKRVKDVSSWLQYKAKKNRNTGQAYWSGSSKKYHPGKALKDGCDREKCT